MCCKGIEMNAMLRHKKGYLQRYVSPPPPRDGVDVRADSGHDVESFHECHGSFHEENGEAYGRERPRVGGHAWLDASLPQRS